MNDPVKLIPLPEAAELLKLRGIPIEYHTLYQWAKNGIIIESKPLAISTQVGNRWYIYDIVLNYMVEEIRSGKRIRIDNKKKTASKTARGRKPGTTFGTYKKKEKSSSAPSSRGQYALSHGMLYS